MEILAYLLTGAVAGLMAGLLGIREFLNAKTIWIR
jgi:hypothetical protein